jgi:hypothetical protein
MSTDDRYERWKRRSRTKASARAAAGILQSAVPA